MLNRVADTVRSLTADIVEKAKSGHPGMPLGCAEIGAVLFSDIIEHDPTHPSWPNRDRFVLSAGHASSFLYAFLHLSGYDLPMSELKRFRQLSSLTPGHPEYAHTPGVETTTGPLGQGLANAVGLALGEAMLAARYNRPNYNIVDHYTYALCSDGDMMEGLSYESASLAGHWGLGKLIVIYDANSISIEGSTNLAFTESVADRFKAMAWHVQQVDGHDVKALATALTAAKQDNRPSLIVAVTNIGRKSIKENSNKAHGEPLGEQALAELKKALGLPPTPFYVPDDVYEFYAARRRSWSDARTKWEDVFAAWSAAYPKLRQQWDAAHAGQLPDTLATQLPQFTPDSQMATRDAGGKVLQAVGKQLPYLVGGSADLSPSTKTYLEGLGSIQKGSYNGQNLHFGIREHAMGAIINGLTLHGGWRVFGSTFLSFADYMRPAIRMAALMNLPVIYIFTHDSIYVGEDGPTHQPIEHVESLRIIPNLMVLRPADAAETKEAWLQALKRTNGPTALILTRQKLPTLTTELASAGLPRGGYILRAAENGSPQLVLAASGSEVSLAVEAAQLLAETGVNTSVVSIPCRDLFMAQDNAYKESVLPTKVPCLIVEAGVPTGWLGLAGPNGAVHGINRFGESGPAAEVAKHLGFTAQAVADHARQLL